MTDTTDLLPASGPAHGAASTEQDTSAAADSPAPRTRRRATSGGLAAMVLPELQAMAGELGISGVGRLRKSQLIEAIQERQGGGAAAAPAASKAAANGGSSRRATTEDSTPSDSVDEARTDERPAEDRDGESRHDGDRPERIDRGRERFLEREARRQERLAQQGEGGPTAPATDRQQSDRGDRPQNDRGDRPQRDRPQGDRPQGDRPQGRDTGGPRQDRDAGGQGGPRRDEEDEFGARRGRFRERGRRNRSGRPGNDRFGNEADPIINEDDVLLPVGGILDILDNYGFVRTSGYLTGPSDVYVSLSQVRKYGLRRGDAVTGAVRQQREGERKDKYNALVRLDTINGLDVEEARKRPDFTKLTPLYPQDRLRLETEPGILTTRVIDLVMPIGKGQRALIVSPPKAGKTMVMQAIANAITTNNPECHLMVVLVDERPEEVTDMQRSVKGEVIASTFDRPPQDHITVAELSIERAKRLV
ncbi:MAG: rho, partial [Frankiales bacterium]|nr:rho [Frankiales bacterium]